MTTRYPWFADDFIVRDENQLHVATCSSADDAEQIVREHNAHAPMLAALRGIVADFDRANDTRPDFDKLGDTPSIAAARAALAKVEGSQT